MKQRIILYLYYAKQPHQSKSDIDFLSVILVIALIVTVSLAFDKDYTDPEKIADRQTLSDYLESLPNCIYEAGDENVDGTGNYYYNVTDDKGKVITSLIMVDSHSWDKENNGYDHFHDNQIDMFQQTAMR